MCSAAVQVGQKVILLSSVAQDEKRGLLVNVIVRDHFGIYDPFSLKKTSLRDTSFQRGASPNPILSWRRIRVVQVFVSQPYYLQKSYFLVLLNTNLPEISLLTAAAEELQANCEMIFRRNQSRSCNATPPPLPAFPEEPRFTQTGRFKFQPIKSAECCSELHEVKKRTRRSKKSPKISQLSLSQILPVGLDKSH